MTHDELHRILSDRINIVRNTALSAKERQAENEITQTVINVIQFMLTYLNSGQDDTADITKLSEKQQSETQMPMPNTIRSKSHYLFNDQHEKWLIDNFDKYEAIRALTRAFNECFEMNVSPYLVGQKCSACCLTKTKPDAQPQLDQTAAESECNTIFDSRHKTWLIDNFENYPTITRLTEAFNEHFGVNTSRYFIRQACVTYGLMQYVSKAYTIDEDDWLKTHANTVSYETLAELFQEKFGRKTSACALRDHCKRCGLNDTVESTRLSKGHTVNKKAGCRILKACHEKWLIDNFDNYETTTELTEAFNKHFDMYVSRYLITQRCVACGLKNHASKAYTAEEDDWLKKHVHTMPYDSLSELFQEQFGRHVSSTALLSHCRYLGVYDKDHCYYQVQSDKTDNIEPDTQYEEPIETKSKRNLTFTERHKAWLINNFNNYPNTVALTDAFNTHFGLCTNRQLISEKCKLYGLMEHNSRKYTPKEDTWLKKYANTTSYESLADLFQVRFGREVSASALKSHCRNLGILDRKYCTMSQAGNDDNPQRKSAPQTQTPDDIKSLTNGKSNIVITNSVNYIVQKT